MSNHATAKIVCTNCHPALSFKRKGTEIVRLALHLASYEESLSHLDDSPVSRIVTFPSINVNVYNVQSLTHR